MMLRSIKILGVELISHKPCKDELIVQGLGASSRLDERPPCAFHEHMLPTNCDCVRKRSISGEQELLRK